MNNLDETTREQIIRERLPQVKIIAKRIAAKLPSHIDLDDLVSAGLVGLCDALEKFNPRRGVLFKSYAETRIRGAIIDSLRKLDWATRPLRKKSKDLDNVRRLLEQRLGRSASDQEMADEMGIPLGKFYKLAREVDCLEPVELLEPSEDYQAVNDDPLENRLPVEPVVETALLAVEKSQTAEVIKEAINALPAKERLVIFLYYFDELTMKQVGKVLGVNVSRISQLHTKAVRHLWDRLYPVLKQNKKHLQTPCACYSSYEVEIEDLGSSHRDLLVSQS